MATSTPFTASQVEAVRDGLTDADRAELVLFQSALDLGLVNVAHDAASPCCVAADLAHRQAAVAYVRELVIEHQLEFGGPTEAYGISMILGVIAGRLS